MDELLAAAVGLARTMDTAPDEQALNVLCTALHAPDADSVERLHEEKLRLSPDCRTCPTPCGRHADYDAAQDDPALYAVKSGVWRRLLTCLRDTPQAQTDMQAVLRLVFYLGESWVSREDLERVMSQITRTRVE